LIESIAIRGVHAAFTREKKMGTTDSTDGTDFDEVGESGRFTLTENDFPSDSFRAISENQRDHRQNRRNGPRSSF
jgi:hypothetical protein